MFSSDPDSLDCNALFSSSPEEELDPFLNATTDLTTYGTRVRYECPLAQKFDQTMEFQDMECLWDQTWSPTGQLFPCIRKSIYSHI